MPYTSQIMSNYQGLEHAMIIPLKDKIRLHWLLTGFVCLFVFFVELSSFEFKKNVVW